MTGRISIIDLAPVVACGSWPAKAVAGERLPVSATVFGEGHGEIGAAAVLRDAHGVVRQRVTLVPTGPGTDRWVGELTPAEMGDWTFTIEAWSDPIATWRHDAAIKIPLGQDVELMCEEGALLFDRAAAGGGGSERTALAKVAATLREVTRPGIDRFEAATSPRTAALLATHPLRDLFTTSEPLRLQVDRERALYGAWYEFFPRSEGARLDPPRSGTFTSAAARLPAIAEMGFDVVYLPPIHPVGRTFRKGPNNTLVAGPDDPGVPWAIGSAEGGHDAIHPDLGTLADFDAFVARARELGMEVALDLALQTSPDHPWVRDHPEWFTRRADGTIAYAENPPKKYQDIYPVNFDNDPEGIYAEVLRIVRHWMAHDVRIFRVDNPHTKPVMFWERLLAEVHASDPDVLFLAEAFTRPAMMHMLGKVGFHQSYTYFTWRNDKAELTAYLRELADESVDFLRPNFFVNTPDILHAYLQDGGRAAFKVRATLAATASPTWGVYSGYELCENTPAAPGSEEYLHSEKYQYSPRDWATPDSLAPYLGELNQIRRAHPALHRLRNLRFHYTDNDAVLAYSKTLDDDRVLVVINLDPHHVQEATVSLDLAALEVDGTGPLDVTDVLSGGSWTWGASNYVRLDPSTESAHILIVKQGQP